MVQIFSKSFNKIPRYFLFFLLFSFFSIIFIIWYFFSPWNTEVGYQPKQPIPYSHDLHVSKLGIDCRYCHINVEKSPLAGIPSTKICMNCHVTIKNDSINLTNLNYSYENDTPIEWIRVNKLPDYVYFDHSTHVLSGVGCFECHGDISKMNVVKLEKPLSMQWCFDCHKNPYDNLRPLDKITDMKWEKDSDWKNAVKSVYKNIQPTVESCSGCHR